LDGISNGNKDWKFSKFLEIFVGEFENRKTAVKAILVESRSNEGTVTTKEEFKRVKRT